MNVIVYAIPVFLLLMAAEFALGLASGRNVYRLNDAVGSLAARVLSQISGVFMLALSVGIYSVVYAYFALLKLPADGSTAASEAMTRAVKAGCGWMRFYGLRPS